MKFKIFNLLLFITFFVNQSIFGRPIPVIKFRQVDDGIIVDMKPGVMKLQVLSSKIIRILYTPADTLPKEKNSHATIDLMGGKTKFSSGETSEEIFIKTDMVQAKVNKKTGALSFFDNDGKLLLKEPLEGGKNLIPKRMRQGIMYEINQKFVTTEDEAFYGLGQQWHGYMNFKGTTEEIWQNNTTDSNPVIHSSKGYSLFWDNASEGLFQGGNPVTLIPLANMLTPDGSKHGLKGAYYQDTDFKKVKAERIDTSINFEWGNKAPHDSINPKSYAVRWTGKIKTPAIDGEYFFHTITDYKIRVWINGQMVIENWIFHHRCHDSGKIRLEANKEYDIQIDYVGDAEGVSEMKLFWNIPGKPIGEVVWNFSVGNSLDYYFIYGPSMDEQVAGYRQLTGKAPMMPKWAYGLFHSNAVAKDNTMPVPQKEIEGYVDGYRSRKIPIDVIVQDFYYWPEGLWGSHQWQSKTHPDPKGMIDYVHKNNMHLMLTIWPIFQEENPNGLVNPNFRELEQTNNLLIAYDKDNKFSWYNPWKAEARKIYWNQVKRQLDTLGVDAWWLDSSEGPNQHLTMYHWWQESFVGATQALRFANEFSLMHSQTIYEGSRQSYPDKRVFILTRSVFAGQQRYASAVWSGDIGVDFWTLKHQIPAGLNFSISGVPYWTTDIGGFGGGFPHYSDYNGRDPDNPIYKETFIRWFQFGAFCPIFRIHGATGRTAVYEFDKETEKILTPYINLRYRLMPYIYSLAWKVTNSGSTIMRPLVMDFPDDNALVDITDQYMFGNALLINPVTDYKARSRQLYLPKCLWYDFWTGKSIQGGVTIQKEAPLNKMPIFVKAGSILPMGPYLQYALEKQADVIELRIYTGADGNFVLYEDDGLSYNYEKGEYATISFNWQDNNKTLEIGNRKGEFPGMLKERVFRLVIVSNGRGEGIAPESKIQKIVKYNGEQISVKL